MADQLAAYGLTQKFERVGLEGITIRTALCHQAIVSPIAMVGERLAYQSEQRTNDNGEDCGGDASGTASGDTTNNHAHFENCPDPNRFETSIGAGLHKKIEGTTGCTRENNERQARGDGQHAHPGKEDTKHHGVRVNEQRTKRVDREPVQERKRKACRFRRTSKKRRNTK